MTGAELIAAERQRQITAEGWTAGHDAHHINSELALAAACYALPQRVRPSSTGLLTPTIWPWRRRDWKPTPGDRVRELVKAGALIAAEIDRLRAAGPPPGDSPVRPAPHRPGALDPDADLTEDGWPL